MYACMDGLKDLIEIFYCIEGKSENFKKLNIKLRKKNRFQ